MIFARMSRVAKVVLTVFASGVAAATLSACGQRINVPTQNSALHQGALLFNQRCSGCHTLSYAATQGSAAKVQTKEFNNGPNFNVRCERPLARVLYAIENGGFSGAIMPQNIVVGPDAVKVAQFVATYAGRRSPGVPGVVSCARLAIGTIPALAAAGTSTTATTGGRTPHKKGTAAKVGP